MVVIRTPATVGNFGPAFDTLSLALHGLGDVVSVERGKEDRITLAGSAEGIPTDWARNVAGIALGALRSVHDIEERYDVRIDKRWRGGSGLGSSASSAAGAALAFHALHPELDLPPRTLLDAAWTAERAAGGGNPDDVAAVVTGGIALVRQEADGVKVSRIQPPAGLFLGVVAPAASLPTSEMRALLSPRIARDDVVWNLGRVALLVHACHEDDIPAMGRCMDDRLHVPDRLPRLPHFAAARQAALDAGAFGACLSGSGPAMVAVTDDGAVAAEAAKAMAEACHGAGMDAEAVVARPEPGVMYEEVLRAAA